MGEDNGGTTTCLPQAIHASRRRAESGRMVRADRGASRASRRAVSSHGSRLRSWSGSDDPLERIADGEDAEQDWQAIVRIVDNWLSGGVPASNREIRRRSADGDRSLPERDDFPAGFRLVLREIDRYLARRRCGRPLLVSHVPSAEVDEAARLLRGRSIVLIGGIRRREAQESCDALGLAELIWIETKEHQSIDSFEPMICAGRRGCGLTRDSLVEPRFWRCEVVLRSTQQTTGATARWL